MTPGMKGAISGLEARKKYDRYIREWATKAKEAVSKKDINDPDYEEFVAYVDDIVYNLNRVNEDIDALLDMLIHSEE